MKNISNTLPASDSIPTTLEEMVTTLHDQKWLHIPFAGEQKFYELATTLGSIIHRTEVVVKTESQGLVTSCKPLDFHTDHSLADYVAWLCVRPAKEGGETILADARNAFSLLSLDDQKTLETVMLKEHRMFENDPLQSPLVSKINGDLKFYYSFWLVDKKISGRQKKAFDAFRRSVDEISFHEFKLNRNDILFVDNSCILHGRRAISDTNRQLKRLWIRSSFVNQPS